MREKVNITLIYEARGLMVDGSPTTLTTTKQCNANIEKQFSQYYYRDNHRVMRNSKNITIPKEFADDFKINENRYQLRAIEIDESKYYVREILKHKSSFLKILDCEEMV